MNISKTKRPPRFLIPEANSAGQALELSEDLMHYASRVLRLADDSDVVLWDGLGREFVAKVHYSSRKSAEFRVSGTAPERPPVELLRPIEIVQALPESDKMDWVIEKCTEMGASRFHPVEAVRSVVKLKGDRADKKQRHWQKVAESAAIQSGRMVCPTVEPVSDLLTAIQSFQERHPLGWALVFDPEALLSLQDLVLTTGGPPANAPQALLIAVGPEGGWTEEEINTATKGGARVLKFCPRILRTETFALACLSQLTLQFALEPI